VYPVTADGIPVMWTRTLEQTFANLGNDLNVTDPQETDVKAANINVYDTIAEAYDAEQVHADEITGARLQSAYQQAGGLGGGPHLDVGCGAGNVLTIFEEVVAGPHIGMDVSLSALRAIRRKGFLAVLGDAERLPFRPESIGLLTASSVLHHLFDPQRLIREAHQVLRDGGVFLTDFDPHGRAAQWGWLARQLYQLRRPVYHLLSLGRRRVFHGSEQVQTWNMVAEFHNKPGEGFDRDELGAALRQAGFDRSRIFAHNGRDAAVDDREFVEPSARHLLVQTLSGRNAFARRNADTLLTVSVKDLSAVQRPSAGLSPAVQKVVRDWLPALESGPSGVYSATARIRTAPGGCAAADPDAVDPSEAETLWPRAA
jgi:ubiquinone/menaquinone biosynthesis C-methylase UbiE